MQHHPRVDLHQKGKTIKAIWNRKRIKIDELKNTTFPGNLYIILTHYSDTCDMFQPSNPLKLTCRCSSTQLLIRKNTQNEHVKLKNLKNSDNFDEMKLVFLLVLVIEGRFQLDKAFQFDNSENIYEWFANRTRNRRTLHNNCTKKHKLGTFKNPFLKIKASIKRRFDASCSLPWHYMRGFWRQWPSSS